MKNALKQLIPAHLKAKIRSHAIDWSGRLSLNKNVECNICGRKASKFFKYRRRENALCSGCFSLERHRFLFECIKEKTPDMLSKAVNILHVAPEKCLSNQIKKNNQVKYITADNMSQYLHTIESSPDYVMDLKALKFDNDFFDYVICNHVLEHIDDDNLAISELYRVLTPGGSGFVNVPLHPQSKKTLEDHSLTEEQRKKEYGATDHLRYYGVDDFTAQLRTAGFLVEVIHIEDLNNLDPQKNGVMLSEQAILVKKPLHLGQ